MAMAIRGNESKRKRKRKKTRTIKREDRLSSLPDDILIKILSCLPLRLAMATGCLSRRWRDLWTNVTSIHIDSNNLDCSRDLDTTFNDIITRITSPLIHRFSVELGDVHVIRLKVKYPKRNLNYSWLRQICDRNVRELKVTNTNVGDLKKKNLAWSPLPSFICVIQSLVSLELDTALKLQLPDDGDPINLPNLKKLHLCAFSMNAESLEKLIKACPALEELGCFRFICPRMRPMMPLRYIKFSHQNLQRLLIKDLPHNYRVVLNVPKLKYLAIRASKSLAFRFEEEPIMLCEAKIDLIDYNHHNCALTEDEIKSMTKFYGLFCNVSILTPDVFVLENSWPSNMFCNATQLTLSMYTPYNIDILLAILELCPPVLDVLTLQIRNSNGMERAAKTPGLVHVTVDSSSHRMEGAQIREMKLCQILYQCPVLSAGCEVEFVGKFFKMSRKGGLKIWIANGKDSPIN